MKRPLPWILALLASAAVAGGFYALAKRDRAAAPTQSPAEAELFKAAPSGQGALLSLNAGASQPLRAVRFLHPLADGEVIAQALTQTGAQMIGRFEQGRFAGSIHIRLPDGMPEAFFRFARLQDAARLEDGALLLLFVDGTGSGAASWLVCADADTGEAIWAVKAAGTRLAMEPGGASCLIWGKDTLGRAAWSAAPGFKPLPLPSGVSVLDAVLPAPGNRMFIAHPGGLAILSRGAWSLTPLPEPALAFPGAPGVLAASGKAVYWQPRPGQLMRIGDSGAPEPVDLAKLALPKGRERDALLLRLAGADAGHRLWFSLATPDLTVAPHPSQPTPAGPSAAMQALAAMNGSQAAPAPAETAPAFDPAAWADYLKDGLDRVYAWDPNRDAPRLVDWKARWPALGAPSDFPLPMARHLQPEGGALLLDLDTRAWWAPLDKL